MHSLYVDSTAGLVVGLMDSNLNWVEYLDLDEKKPSEVIHQQIYTLMEKYNLNFKDTNFIFSAGPGSYTGMRLSEGIAQILSWDDKHVFSFHHFEVPALAGIEKGYWVTNAFKGQVFVYNWDSTTGKVEKELVNSKDFSIIDPSLGFTLGKDVAPFVGLKSTKELIHQRPQEIFRKVLDKKLREPPFYFRTLDEEFK
jgi:tRNA threonylcarbamoyladenosine biosynthesis protein TsaB